jgi:hypothetical protein
MIATALALAAVMQTFRSPLDPSCTSGTSGGDAQNIAITKIAQHTIAAGPWRARLLTV